MTRFLYNKHKFLSGNGFGVNKFVKNSQNHKLLLEKFERLALSSSQADLYSNLKRKKNTIFFLALGLAFLLFLIGALYTYRLVLLSELNNIATDNVNVKVLGEKDSNALKQLKIISSNIPNLSPSGYMINYQICQIDNVSNCQNRSEVALAFGSNHYLISRNPNLIDVFKENGLKDKSQLEVFDQFDNQLYLEDYFLAGEHIFVRVTQNIINPIVDSGGSTNKILSLSTDENYGLQLSVNNRDYLTGIDDLTINALLGKIEPQATSNRVSNLWQTGLIALNKQDYQTLSKVGENLQNCACLDNNFQFMTNFSTNISNYLNKQKLENLNRGLIALTLSSSLILFILFLTIYSYQKISSEFYYNNFRLRQYQK